MDGRVLDSDHSSHQPTFQESIKQPHTSTEKWCCAKIVKLSHEILQFRILHSFPFLSSYQTCQVQGADVLGFDVIIIDEAQDRANSKRFYHVLFMSNVDFMWPY